MKNDFNQFVSTVREELLRLTGLPAAAVVIGTEEGRDQEERLMLHLTKGEKYHTALSIRLKDLYHAYQCEQEPEDIAESILSSAKRAAESHVFDIAEEISDYARAKPRLSLRLLPYAAILEDQRELVYKKLGDIALVLYCDAGTVGTEFYGIKADRSMLDNWNVSEEEAIDAALQNTLRQMPPRIYHLEKLLENPEYSGVDIKDEIVLDREQPAGICLSNEKKFYGAVSILLPGAAERIGAILDSDYLIVFTSVHEAMLHRLEEIDLDSVQKVLKEINYYNNKEEDILTYSLYRYSREDGQIRCLQLE